VTPLEITNRARERVSAVWRRYTRETLIPPELYQALQAAVVEAYDAGRDNPRNWPDEEVTQEYAIQKGSK
jgi:hypothetical protein